MPAITPTQVVRRATTARRTLCATFFGSATGSSSSVRLVAPSVTPGVGSFWLRSSSD